MKIKQSIFRYYWKTENPLSTNAKIINDFLNNHLSGKYEILLTEGTYAEIKDLNNNKFAVHASGNGDFCHHKIEFEKI